MRVSQQKGHLLLTKPWRESSWIGEFFTHEFGRISLLAKGARREKSQLKAVLMPCQPLLLSWSGRGELATLTKVETSLPLPLRSQQLYGKQLSCGIYCNELIFRLLYRHDPHPQLYEKYAAVMESFYVMNKESHLMQRLRAFEYTLMKETGYDLDFLREAENRQPIECNNHYVLRFGSGFARCQSDGIGAVLGKVILSLAYDRIDHLNDRENMEAKHLMRSIISDLLGQQSLFSRRLFYTINDIS